MRLMVRAAVPGPLSKIGPWSFFIISTQKIFKIKLFALDSAWELQVDVLGMRLFTSGDDALREFQS